MMKRVFTIHKTFRVPDGTLVSPFLNPTDSESGLPFGLIDGFSLAAGVIEPRSESKIHIFPFVTQVTFVLRGSLKVLMKGVKDDMPYSLIVEANQAILTEPSTFFQLVNEGDESCEVLYIVSPPYLFEKSHDGRVVYDDSAVLDEDWEDLEASDWYPSSELPSRQQRLSSGRRLAERNR